MVTAHKVLSKKPGTIDGYSPKVAFGSRYRERMYLENLKNLNEDIKRAFTNNPSFNLKFLIASLRLKYRLPQGIILREIRFQKNPPGRK